MEFLSYFSNVFTFTNLLILLFGTVGGLLMGAAPGLSPTMAVALLIPFTFKMSPEQGLIMLGGVYTSTVAGGAISCNSFKNTRSTCKHSETAWVTFFGRLG